MELTSERGRVETIIYVEIKSNNLPSVLVSALSRPLTNLRATYNGIG